MTNSLEHTNGRGNTRQRRARKRWLLSVEAGWGGDGLDVPCWECGVLCEYEDLFADRIVSAQDGGRYDRANVAPHCGLCSHRQGQKRTVEICNDRRKACLPAVNVVEMVCGDSPKPITTVFTAPTPNSAPNGSAKLNGQHWPVGVSTA